jgi:hypothetical protein
VTCSGIRMPAWHVLAACMASMQPVASTSGSRWRDILKSSVVSSLPSVPNSAGTAGLCIGRRRVHVRRSVGPWTSGHYRNAGSGLQDILGKVCGIFGGGIATALLEQEGTEKTEGIGCKKGTKR